MAARKKPPAKRKAPAKKAAAAKKPAVKKAPAKRKVPAKAKATPKKVAAKRKPAAKKPLNKATVEAIEAEVKKTRPDLLGNQFWKLRSSHGANPIFKTPEDLWQACCEYFEWVESNPLQETQAFAYKGKVNQEPLPKMRAMTLNALYIFLDIDQTTWLLYRHRDEFKRMVEKVENIIWTQKFTGAAADLLNGNIIARELGLKEKSEQEVSGPGGEPVEHKVTFSSDKEASDYYQAAVHGLPKP